MANPTPVTYAKGSTEFTRAAGGERIIIRWPEVHRRTGRSRTSAWRDTRKGKFPAPVEIGDNAIGWYEDEIAAWLEARPRAAYAAWQGR